MDGGVLIGMVLVSLVSNSNDAWAELPNATATGSPSPQDGTDARRLPSDTGSSFSMAKKKAS